MKNKSKLFWGNIVLLISNVSFFVFSHYYVGSCGMRCLPGHQCKNLAPEYYSKICSNIIYKCYSNIFIFLIIINIIISSILIYNYFKKKHN